MVKINPLHGIIAVRLDEREATEGGIALINMEKLDYGVIVATGPGEYQPDGDFREVSVQPGQRIVIAPGSGVELDVDDQTLRFMTQDDIVGIINEKNEIENV